MNRAGDTEGGIKRQARFVVQGVVPDDPVSFFWMITDRERNNRDATVDLHRLAMQRGVINEGWMYPRLWLGRYLEKASAGWLVAWANHVHEKARPV